MARRFARRRATWLGALLTVALLASVATVIVLRTQEDEISEAPLAPIDLARPELPVTSQPPARAGTVRYVNADGSGARDGKSRSDAAAFRSLDSMVKAVGPGGEVRVLGGQPIAVGSPVKVSAGGAPGEPVSIVGEGGPVITGDRVLPYRPDGERGPEALRLSRGADHLRVDGLSFANIGDGAIRLSATITDVTIQNIEATNVRRLIENRASGEEPDASVTDLVVRNVKVQGFSKGALRLAHQTSRVLVEDVIGDSQFQDGDDFAIGVHLEDRVHDVTIRRTTMMNTRDTKNTYWNGDGFATEGQVRDVLFEESTAKGNTDGGFDVKSQQTSFIRTVAADNKRNYRVWSGGATMLDCQASNPESKGGDGSAAQVQLNRTASVRMVGCRLDASGAPETAFDLPSGSRLTADRLTMAGSAASAPSVVDRGALLSINGRRVS